MAILLWHRAQGGKLTFAVDMFQVRSHVNVGNQTEHYNLTISWLVSVGSHFCQLKKKKTKEEKEDSHGES